MPRFLEVGRIAGTHGIRGDLRVECWCDGPEFLGSFGVLLVGDGETPYDVELARPHKRMCILKLKGVDSVEAAQALRGGVLKADVSGITLPEGRWFVRDLIGLKVVDDGTGGVIGRLDDVLERPAHDVYVVTADADGREILIPAVAEFIKDVDINSRVMRVKTIEGM